MKLSFLPPGDGTIGWPAALGDEVESAIPGTYLLIDLLKQAASSQTEIPIAGDVVITGSGKSAVEAARICKERGAGSITIVQRGAAAG